jgi:hypothetical protein
MTVLRSRRLRRAAARADLHAAVDEILKQLHYDSRWELTRLRQADLGGRYYIVDASGLIIDVEGFPADLTFRADVTDLQPGIHSLTVPLTNETWRLLVAPVKGGRVTLGVTPPEDITTAFKKTPNVLVNLWNAQLASPPVT